MPLILATTWWSLLIRGLAGVALGIVVLALGDVSVGRLTLFFFGYAMIDGVVNLAGGITAAEEGQRWRPLLVEAAASIAAALVAAAWPGLSPMDLIYIIAAWGLATGALEIVSAVRLRKRVRGEWMLALSGAASIALGIVMVGEPLAATSSVALQLGVYALLFGFLLVGLALRQRARVGAEHPLHA